MVPHEGRMGGYWGQSVFNLILKLVHFGMFWVALLKYKPRIWMPNSTLVTVSCQSSNLETPPTTNTIMIFKNFDLKSTRMTTLKPIRSLGY